MVKLDVWKIVEQYKISGCILLALNATFLTLIPKCEGADTPGKFRPISICNVIYKIITKVIANRLKPILPSLISLEQYGCVEGRQISDGIILVHEMLHSLKSEIFFGMVIKLDIAKAYDKLNWKFIRKIIEAFGFNQNWVNWIMQLVSSDFFLYFGEWGSFGNY